MQITSPVDYLVNALEGIKADGTDHPQVEMHRRIAERALERYRAAAARSEFPRELPPGAVLVDSAECRVLTVTGEDAERVKNDRPSGTSCVYRGNVEDLPASGP